MADKEQTLDITKCREIGRCCTCYNLRKASRALTRLYDDFLRPCGLRTTQLSLLMSARLKGPVSLTKLADLTVTERTTLSRNLTIIEKKGLVRIEQGSDRREREVVLTEKGRDALLAAIPLWEKAQAHIGRGLGEERMSQLLEDLSRIVSLTRQA